MFYEGAIIGLATFLIIGLFHPIVIKSEYHFGTKCWWVFLIMGLIGIAFSLTIENTFLSALISVFAFSSFWTILEIFEQRERVNKGWFPANPKRKKEYKIRAYSYKYPHPAITADCVLFAYNNSDIQVLLIERGLEPYKGCWALPGGFMEMNETTKECSKREMFEETGIKVSNLIEVGCYSTVDRDPRERVVTITYCTMERSENVTPKAGDDAAKCEWFSINNLPQLAFDHKDMIHNSIECIKQDITKAINDPQHNLNKKFSMDELKDCITKMNYTK